MFPVMDAQALLVVGDAQNIQASKHEFVLTKVTSKTYDWSPSKSPNATTRMSPVSPTEPASMSELLVNRFLGNGHHSSAWALTASRRQSKSDRVMLWHRAGCQHAISSQDRPILSSTSDCGWTSCAQLRSSRPLLPACLHLLVCQAKVTGG
jgi:hypothetical protein